MNFERTIKHPILPHIQTTLKQTWYRPWIQASWHKEGCELAKPPTEKSETVNIKTNFFETLPGRYCRNCTLTSAISITHSLTKPTDDNLLTLIVLSIDGIRNNVVSHSGALRLKEWGQKFFSTEPAQTAYGPALIIETNQTCASILTYNLAAITIPEKIDNYTTEIFLNQLQPYIPLVAGHYSQEPFDATQQQLIEKAWTVSKKVSELTYK